MFTRAAAVTPSTLNEGDRSVEVVFSTGARVRRADGYDESYFEELSLKPEHVRLARLQSGAAPVLMGHKADSVEHVVGVVESARLEKGHGLARLRFVKDDPAADSVWLKIRQGVLRQVSVGYQVHRFEDSTRGAERIRTATDWEPFEVSVVTIGADAGAMVRSQEEGTMEPETEPTTVPTDTATERTRVGEILALVRGAQLEPSFAEPLIREGRSLDQARHAVLEAMMARGLPDAGPRPGPSGVSRVTGTDDFRRAAADALCLRAGIPVRSPHPAARDLLGTSVVELAKISLSRVGQRIPGGGPTAILTRAGAHTTSDFPAILTDSIGAAIRNGYETEPASHRVWVRTTTVSDFRLQQRPILSSMPALLKVLEHGEYTRGSLSDEGASYRVEKWGRVIGLTMETLVNDYLDSFLRVQPGLGQSARRAEADAVYALFALNSGAGPTMPDGHPLFDSANHHNVAASATTLDAAALGAGRTLLRRQTALGGGYLSLVPAFLIVPPELETTAEMLLASGTRQSTATATLDAENPEWIARLTLVVEPRLPTGAVYLATSPTQIDTVELGLLEENVGGPVLDTRAGFDIDMLETKARHTFGVQALDYRGMVKMPISAVGLLGAPAGDSREEPVGKPAPRAAR